MFNIFLLYMFYMSKNWDEQVVLNVKKMKFHVRFLLLLLVVLDKQYFMF